MKRLLAFVLALVICLVPLSPAYAASSNIYSVLNGRQVYRSGMSDPHIRELQQALIDLGYMTGGADGIYGSKTEDAVRAFQRKNGFAGQIGYAGVATMFTQAVLFSRNAIPAYSHNSVSNNVDGEYGIRNTKFRYTTQLTGTYDFVNYETQHVTALCVYYWLEDSRENLVTMNGYSYYMNWYYGLDIAYNKTCTLNYALDATSQELNKACTLRFLVGEIAYADGSYYISFNASKMPYENARYLMGSW